MSAALLGRLLPGSQHFHVIEDPAYAASGTGEHLYVEIEKEGLTSDEVAVALARACDVKSVDVGFAGRKDRHAITRQWFSVRVRSDEHLGKLGTAFAKGRLAVLNVSRHGNKIRTGHLAGNRFRLGLADVEDVVQLQAALDQLARFGLANRFGPQRFGFDGANLRIAAAWGAGDLDTAVALVVDPSGNWSFGDPLPTRFRLGPEGKVLGALKRGSSPAQALKQAEELRKLIASAGQAAIFNAVLDARRGDHLLHRLRVGDIAATRQGAQFQVAAEDIDEVNRRAAPGMMEVVGTGPLPGTWRLAPSSTVLAEEVAWSAATGFDWAWFGDGGAFESPGNRRPLVVPFRTEPKVTPGEVTWVDFALPAGAFATEVLLQARVELPDKRSA